MAVTTPYNIYSPDGTGPWNLVIDLGLMANSVNSALTTLRADIITAVKPVDSGWSNLSLGGAITAEVGNVPRIRKIGKIVYLAGRSYRSTTAGSAVIAGFPTGMLPQSQMTFQFAAVGGGGVFVTIDTSGSMSATTATTGYVSWATFPPFIARGE